MSYYGKVTYQDIDYMVMINEKGEYWVDKDCSGDDSRFFTKSASKIMLDGFTVKEENKGLDSRIFFIDSLIIYQADSNATALKYQIH